MLLFALLAFVKVASASLVKTPIAGISYVSGQKDGPASNATFGMPTSCAIDIQGNIYVSDYTNNNIRKISVDGQVTTWAGSSTGASGNGQGIGANMTQPYGLAFDTQGNLWFSSSDSSIRKISPTGYNSIIAGLQGVGAASNGFGADVSFRTPHGIDFSS